jgi:protein involved in polysaccharide export with SLBB domain
MPTTSLTSAFVRSRLASIVLSMSLMSGAMAQTGPVATGAVASPASSAGVTQFSAAGAEAAIQAVNLTPDANAIVPEVIVDPGLVTTAAGQAIVASSQFQTFVKRATGLDLPIFGSELFSKPTTYQPITNIAPPSNYALGPGDQIQLQAWGSIDINMLLAVDKRGVLTVPKVGPLSVAGLKVGQLDSALQAHLSKVFRNVEVSATVARLRSIQVYVVGQARSPGTYTLSSLSSLVNALFASGGPNAFGSMRNIELRRDNTKVGTIDLYDFIIKGERGGDFTLQAGDVIVIPPVGPQVALVGALDNAAIYELKGASTLNDLLQGVGGVPVLTKTRGATLERVVKDQTPARQIADITLNAIGLATVLTDGDIVTLKPISLGLSNEVTLRGPGPGSARVPWFEGMRVTDLIADPKYLIGDDYFERKLGAAKGESVTAASNEVRGRFDAINWDYALIERLDQVALKNQLINFNLGAAILQRDPANNLALKPGDVVTVFNQNDIRLPEEKQFRLVKVEGEVAAPGIYNAQPGETLAQLLRRVGGLSPQAYVFGTEFTRQSVREQQQNNLDRLITQLESSLTSQSGQLASAVSTDKTAARLAAQQEAQRQTQEQQLSRLRTMNSSGRIALELTPGADALASLPHLPLEDGDSVFVPATPSFVAAFGAVNNQNVVVYRPGRTVSDLMRLAGLTEAADPSRAFVLRADGTVFSAYDSGPWGSNSFESSALMPGDALVVPPKLDQESTWSSFIRNGIDITQILANLGLGLAALRSL